MPATLNHCCYFIGLGTLHLIYHHRSVCSCVCVCVCVSMFVSKSGPNLTWPERTAASSKMLGPRPSLEQGPVCWTPQASLPAETGDTGPHHLYSPSLHSSVLWRWLEWMCMTVECCWGETTKRKEKKNNKKNTLKEKGLNSKKERRETWRGG